MKFIHLFRCNSNYVASKQMWRIMNLAYGKLNEADKRKWFMRIKLIIVIMTAFLIHVSASSNAQLITLKQDHVTLKRLFSDIKKQTGYVFLYKSGDLEKTTPVNVDVKNATIEEVLGQVFKNQNLEYSIDSKSVVISVKSPSFFEKVVARFQEIDVRGKVVDEKGEPLVGATVKVLGGKGTTTNADGEFYLEGVDEKAKIQVSFIGYKMRELVVSKEMEVRLDLGSAELEEVQVINKGYYTTTKELNTGNVSVISSREIEKSPLGDPIAALQGRAAGVFISQNNGVAGSGINVQIRGQNSLRKSSPNGNLPLYVVDGVPFISQPMNTNTQITGAAFTNSPFASIQQNDIEKIEILKDADATAIYGSRGANGVVLITTKKGQSGKTAFNFNIYQGMGQVGHKLDLMNTEEYLAMRRTALANDNISAPGTADNDLNGKWGDINRYTDWQKVLIGGTASITDATASVSGGNDQTQALFGGTYRRQTDVFPGDFDDIKTSGHLSVNHQSLNHRFKSSVSVSYSNDNNTLPPNDFTSSVLLEPNAPEIYNPDGSLNWQNSTWTNPLQQVFQKTSVVTTNLNSSANMSYQVLENLSLSLRGGYNIINGKSDALFPLAGADPALGTSPDSRRHLQSINGVKTWIIEPTISFQKKFKFGKIEALVGSSWQQDDQNGLILTASGFTSDALVGTIASATTLRASTEVISKYRYNAIYARIGYNYGDQYLLNLTGRRDASSRFGPGKQFGNFGAAGAAWIFTKQEVVAKALPFISFGKIRASYGITGNDQIPDYGFLSTLRSGGVSYQGVSVLNPFQLYNPDLQWETVNKLEVGVDLGILNDRVALGVSWFRNRTGNQLVSYSLPEVSGFTNVQANLPALLQNTGTEFELTSTNINKDFKWKTSVNFTIPKSKLLKFDNIKNSSYATSYQVGLPLFVSFRYNYLGIDPSTHTYTIQDINNDKRYSSADDQKPYFIGQRSFGGMNNSFSYKGVQLDIFLQYVNQLAGKTASAAAPGVFLVGNSNQMRSTTPNADYSNGIQRYAGSLSSDAQTAYSRYLNSNGVFTNASFLRLKNMSLSLALPEKYTKAAHLQNARIYLTGQNIFTITDYEGFDPENAASGTGGLRLPPLRMFLAGVQFSL